MKRLVSLLACLILLFNPVAKAHSSGADPGACNSEEMKPSHSGGVSTANIGQFQLRIQSSVYDPLNPTTMTVKLESSAGNLFKGFLVQARKVNSFDRVAKGVMEGPPSLSSPICGSTGNGMTHTKEFSNNWRREISLSWRPGHDLCETIMMEDLFFQATVVTDYSEAAQIQIYSPVMRMRNVSAAQWQECRRRASGGTSRATFSTTLGLTMLLLSFIAVLC